jgi:CRISPR-associated protein Csm5
MKVYELMIDILSPIHIGTDDELEPFDYVIRDRKLQRISLQKFVMGLSVEQRSHFEGLIERNDINALRQFIAENADPASALYTADVTSGVETIYERKFSDIGNQLLIRPFIRSELSHDPILPGSSLKGAVRTAIVSHIANAANLPKPSGFLEEVRFESKALGDAGPGNDPFRALKFSDVSMAQDSIVVSEVSNARRTRAGDFEAISIQMFTETTWCALAGRTVKLSGNLVIDDTLQNYPRSVTRKLTIEDVISCCNSFYGDKARKDASFFSATRLSEASRRVLEEPLDKSSFLLRLGRFSGKLSVTLDNYRKPPDPTTRNICDGRYPMGWLKVSVTN